MSRLWIRVLKRHRIDRQHTVPCAWGEERRALEQGLVELDLPAPMWLDKHSREFGDFRRTSFLPDHFVEAVDFERLEIEYLDDTGKKRVSDDPRNQF
jgi:hypothetical protein